MGHYRRWFKQVQFSDHLIVKLRGKKDTKKIKCNLVFQIETIGDDYVVT